MAKFQITGPDGANYEVEAPDDASEQQVLDYVQQKAKPQVSRMESAGRGALQGVTFGFGDEMYGAAAGAYDKLLGSGDFSGTYERERDAVREANDKAQQANPGTFLAGELAGGLALPFGAAKLGVKGIQAANTGLKARSAASAKEGMLYGGAYGFGKAEGDPVEQAIEMAGGAATGGVVGGLVPGAISAASAALRVPMQAARVATQPRSVAAEKMVEAFGRDAGNEGLAGNPLAKAALRTEAERNATGAPLMLADMGGDNVKTLLRNATDMPNARTERLQQTLNRRKSLEGRRLSSSIEDTLVGGDDFVNRMDDLVASRSQLGTSAFTRAYAQPWKVEASSEMVDFLRRGYMQRMLEKTQQSIEGMTGGDLSAIKPWEFLHRVKMEINREIGRMKRGQSDSATNWTISDLTKLNRDFGRLIGKENPSLSAALSKYSDKSAMINAMEEGLDDAFKLSPEELRKNLGKLTQRDQEFYRLGHARAHIERLRGGDVMRDKSKNLYNSDDMGLRLKAVFPEGAPERGRFLKTISAERRMNATRSNVQGNSKTAKYLTSAQEAGKSARTAADVAGAVMGRIDPLLRSVERGVNYASGMTPGVAAEIIDLGMSTGGTRLNAMTSRAIADAYARDQGRNALQRQLTRGALPPATLLGSESMSQRK